MQVLILFRMRMRAELPDMKPGMRSWFAPHPDLAVLYSWVDGEPTKLSVITEQDDGTWYAGMADVGELGAFATRDLAVQAVDDLLAPRGAARELPLAGATDTAFGQPRGRFSSLEGAKGSAEALMEPEGIVPAPGELERLAKEHAEEAAREAEEVAHEDTDAHEMVEPSRLEETPAACEDAAAQDVETPAARERREHERWLADYIDYARDTYPEDMAGLDHDGEVAFVMMLHQSAMERIFGEPRE